MDAIFAGSNVCGEVDLVLPSHVRVVELVAVDPLSVPLSDEQLLDDAFEELMVSNVRGRRGVGDRVLGSWGPCVGPVPVSADDDFGFVVLAEVA